jgi:hypothetical protein
LVESVSVLDPDGAETVPPSTYVEGKTLLSAASGAVLTLNRA